jgi:hypothetical protein
MNQKRPLSKAPVWVETSYLWKKDDAPVERARQKLSRVFTRLGAGEVRHRFPAGTKPGFLGQWNPVSGFVAVLDDLDEAEQIGVQAHELCHVINHPPGTAVPIDYASDAYKREDRIAHIVGDVVSHLLGVPSYSESAERHGFRNWMPPGEWSAEEVAEAAEVTSKIKRLIAEESVYAGPPPPGECWPECANAEHVEYLIVDEDDQHKAEQLVKEILPEGVILLGMTRWDSQDSPRTTQWVARLSGGSITSHGNSPT